jgi:hypothetical protein
MSPNRGENPWAKKISKKLEELVRGFSTMPPLDFVSV